MVRDVLGMALEPGTNVDKIHVGAGVMEAGAIGYDSSEDMMVVTYALQRWMRGEEDGAIKTLMHHGISLTSAYRIVAAARAAMEEEVPDDTTWAEGRRMAQEAVRSHRRFHDLVREVAVAEQPWGPNLDRMRRNSPTYGMWMTRGMKHPRNQMSERAWKLAHMIAAEALPTMFRRSEGDAAAVAYVEARDDVRARLR